MKAPANGTTSTHAPTEGLDRKAVEPDAPQIVFFWAPLCGACEAVALMLDVLALKWARRVKVVEVNVDDEPVVANTFDVRSIPTLVATRDREVVDVWTGAGGLEALEGLFVRLADPLPR